MPVVCLMGMSAALTKLQALTSKLPLQREAGCALEKNVRGDGGGGGGGGLAVMQPEVFAWSGTRTWSCQASQKHLGQTSCPDRPVSMPSSH